MRLINLPLHPLSRPGEAREGHDRPAQHCHDAPRRCGAARARAVLAQILPEPHAALLTGILLGDDAGMSPELQDAFGATGTSHIITISGFNIAIIAGLFYAAATGLFGRRHGLWIAMLGVAAYTLLVGAGA